MEVVRIVLTEPKTIKGIVRNPGYVLLEAICSEKVTAIDISETLRLGHAIVVVNKHKQESGEASY